jgi:undecaprenyl-diphosphatase
LAFALATSVWIYNKKIGNILFVLAFLVAIGRPLVGVHFPLDIFAGGLIGIFTVLVLGKYFKKKYKK